jgi:hypothetical protein
MDTAHHSDGTAPQVIFKVNTCYYYFFRCLALSVLTSYRYFSQNLLVLPKVGCEYLSGSEMTRLDLSSEHWSEYTGLQSFTDSPLSVFSGGVWRNPCGFLTLCVADARHCRNRAIFLTTGPLFSLRFKTSSR